MDSFSSDKIEINGNSLSFEKLPLNNNTYNPGYSHSHTSDASINQNNPGYFHSHTSAASINQNNNDVATTSENSLNQNNLRVNIINSDNLQISSNVYNNNGLQINTNLHIPENGNSLDNLESPMTNFSLLGTDSPETNFSSINLERPRTNRLSIIVEDQISDNSNLDNSRLEIPRVNRNYNPRLSVSLSNSNSIEINHDALYKGTDTQRFFPKIGQCLCCFNFSSYTSFIVSTFIVIVFTSLEFLVCLYYVIYNHDRYYIFIGLVALIAIISNILLLIGAKKKNRIYMRQFMIVYFLYLAVATLGTIRLIGRMYLYNNNEEFYKEQNDLFIVSNKNNGYYSTYNDEQIKGYYQNQYFIRIILSIVFLIIVIFYYMINCSYIETIEENIKKEKIQKFEEAIY